MQHNVTPLDFTFVVSERWSSLPDIENLKKQPATLASAHSEPHDVERGLYASPKEIREVRIPAALADQIRCMWHGHRERDQIYPPVIPLKIFVWGMGQD